MPPLAAFFRKARSAWVEPVSFDSVGVGVGVGSALSVCAASTAESEATAARAEQPRRNLGRLMLMVIFYVLCRCPGCFWGQHPRGGMLPDPMAFTSHLHNGPSRLNFPMT